MKRPLPLLQHALPWLAQHGFEFDVVYTSWLSRAIETAWHVLDEMDSLWLPIIKSWRLNERMYGELTGLSKRMVSQKHGEAQVRMGTNAAAHQRVNSTPFLGYSLRSP